MALSDVVMTAGMVNRAVAQGLINKAPTFGLSRTYAVMAKGVVKTLLDPISTVVSVFYGPGKPAIGFGVAGPTLGLQDLSPDRFAPLAQLGALHLGLFSVPFYSGIAGIVEHIQSAVIMTDFFVPTATGTGTLVEGGVVLNADDCFENMKTEALFDGIMTVQEGVHIPSGQTTIPDPTTGIPLSVGDLFSQSELMLRSVSINLALELLFATRDGILVVGASDPFSTPISGATITTFLS